MTEREQAEFRWREAAKAEREYSLLVEADNAKLRTALEFYAWSTARDDGLRAREALGIGELANDKAR